MKGRLDQVKRTARQHTTERSSDAGRRDLPPAERSANGRGDFLDVARWVLWLNWSTNAPLTLGLITVALVSSVTPAGLALAARGLVNALVEIVSSDAGDIGLLAPWLLLGLGLTVLEAVCGAASRFFNQRLYDELETRVAIDVMTHAADLDVAFFEDQRGQNMVVLAQRGMARYSLQFATRCLAVATGVVQAISLVGILIAIEPTITLVLVPLAVPYLISQWQLTRERYETEHTRTTKRRWLRYFTSRVTDQKWVPETKLLQLAPLLIGQCRALLDEFREQNRLLYRRSVLSELLFVVLATVALYAVLARAATRVLASALTVGDVAIYGGAAARLRNTLQSTVVSISAVREGMLFVSNLREFLYTEPHIVAGPGLVSAGRGAIELRHVSFTYPGSSLSVLNDVSFRIDAGETVALVGENGAGKTTLAKLLARLYDPTAGCILVDGVDLRELSPDDWHNRVGFVFQRFGLYEATAADNIAYGDWKRLLGNREAVKEIARLANVHEMIEGMPEGYDTFLGRLFGVYTLSGGQWQRIAVARAFARKDASLLILDEPTSNLDAKAEYELFCRFRELAAGRTTVLISHRFSTVSMADRILVLDQGRVVEQGTHQELLAQDGHYASLYRLHQRQSG